MLSSYSENSNMNNVDILDQYADLTNSFQELEPSLDDDDSINNFSNQPLILYRSYNPKRKLRRIRNNFNSVKKYVFRLCFVFILFSNFFRLGIGKF